MKSKDIKYVLNIAMRLTVIVAVVVAMLATVNAVTKDRIAENNAASRNAACGELIEGAEFESFDISALNVDYSDITNFDKNSVAVWRGKKNGELAGWCVEVTGKGYSSDGIGLIVILFERHRADSVGPGLHRELLDGSPRLAEHRLFRRISYADGEVRLLVDTCGILCA